MRQVCSTAGTPTTLWTLHTMRSYMDYNTSELNGVAASDIASTLVDILDTRLSRIQILFKITAFKEIHCIQPLHTNVKPQVLTEKQSKLETFFRHSCIPKTNSKVNL